ncbi:MAG TPA: efflux RND transporter periplasmic adaptor subunit [Bacteroidota bacterium]|nr:efflux RND transporter periplasmic adaptor subunit [Bacteroidota bacterium]
MNIQSLSGAVMKKVMRKKVIIPTAVVVVLVLVGLFLFGGSNDSAENVLPRVKAAKGTIVDKALAIGTIEPENEISVKSKVTGVVRKIYADVGTFVKAGEPLLEVKPDPTPLELADAKRQVELKEVDIANLDKEKVRQESLFKSKLISDKEYEDFQKRYDESVLQVQIAKEKLALMESGSVTIGNTQIESIIKAPIDGYVLSRTVEVGDPVTPLTSFQEGTVLMKMANMERLIFKGTVDEIDVGRLKEGMETELKVGALPNDTVKGFLRRIWLKAEKKENATVFPIEILIPSAKNSVLRAGYSANASIIINKKTDVLMIPERTVTFRNDSSFVRFALGPQSDEERLIKTGLSDAINIEVKDGLKEGDEVVEKPVKKIE